MKESVLCVFLSVREKAYVCVVYVCRVCMSVRERERACVCVREGMCICCDGVCTCQSVCVSAIVFYYVRSSALRYCVQCQLDCVRAGTCVCARARACVCAVVYVSV